MTAPFAGRHWRELTADERGVRERWQADEANRLIAARRATQRPSQPVRIQAPDPREVQAAQDRMAAENATVKVLEGLARRDRGLS